ncbi:MAG: hypothetical protein Q4C49_09520 [Bacillota bacterium]|nr:hypothetical protein [Bacillota bacterium]
MFKLLLFDEDVKKNFVMAKKNTISGLVVLFVLVFVLYYFGLIEVQKIFWICLVFFPCLAFDYISSTLMVKETDEKEIKDAYERGKKFNFVRIVFLLLFYLYLLKWEALLPCALLLFLEYKKYRR